MKIISAFHGSDAIKQKYVNRVKAHQVLDQIIHGTYWEDGRGCAVGCTIHSSDHNAYETELGIPAWMGYLEDTLFENMSHSKSLDWPRKFLEAIPVGFSDWDQFYHDFCAHVLKTEAKFDHDKYPDVAKAIYKIINMHESSCFMTISLTAWSAAEKAVIDIANVAAPGAVKSAVWAAAWSAVRMPAGLAVPAFTDSAALAAARFTTSIDDTMIIMTGRRAANDRMSDWILNRFSEDGTTA